MSLSDIITEFGGGDRLSDFLRNGSYVPDTATNSGVPTSPPLRMSDLYGAEDFVADVTPDALAWGNVMATDALTASVDTNEETIGGINTAITLEAVISTSSGSAPVVVPVVDDTAETSPIAVNNGEGVLWRLSALDIGTHTGTVTIRNNSDGNTTLDTFTYNITVTSGGL